MYDSQHDFMIFDIELGYREEVEPHVHDFHELFVTLGGGGEQLVGEGVALRTRPGDFFIFPPGVGHIARGLPDTPCLGGVIYLKPEKFLSGLEPDRELLEWLDRWSAESATGRHRVPLTAAGRRMVGKLFRETLEEFRGRRPGRLAMAHALTRQLLVAAARHGGGAATASPAVGHSPSEENIRRFMGFLESHYAEPVDVDEAARQANVSRSHFHHLFPKVAGTNFTAYLNKLRVRAAERLLADGAPIAAAAVRVGFTSTSHFHKVFRAITGSPPGKVRRRGN